LSESELQGITGVSPLKWAPIDLALEQALGRNGSQLVFDHDFLRKAVEDRYLSEVIKKHEAHSNLAEWFDIHIDWDYRKAQELPWQLQQASRLADLRKLILNVRQLNELTSVCDSRELIKYWVAAKANNDSELDEQIEGSMENEMNNWEGSSEEQISFLCRIADLLNEAGLYRKLLLELRKAILRLAKESNGCYEEKRLDHLQHLADAYRLAGNYEDALPLYVSAIEEQRRVLGDEHPDTLDTMYPFRGRDNPPRTCSLLNP